MQTKPPGMMLCLQAIIIIGLCLGTAHSFHCDRYFDTKHGGSRTKLKCVRTGLKEVAEDQNEPWNVTKLVLQHPPAQMKTIAKPLLAKLTNLRDIDVIFSKIKHFDAGAFTNSPNLLKVNLKSSLLKNIPAKLLVNSTVRYLFIEDTKSLVVPERAPFLISEILEVLYLKSCRIRKISSETFNQLPNLTSLSLKNNRINSIPKDAFSSNPNIRLILLQGNRLTTLSLDSFRENYDRKLVLHLKRNPWVCDCQLKPLMDWEDATIESNNTKCKIPVNESWASTMMNLLCTVSK